MSNLISNKMKAIQYTAFGDSRVLKLNQVDKPVAREGEVLIKIAVFSINPVDIKIREGLLQSNRPVLLPFIPGLDASGVVEQVGHGVTRLKVGDRVVANSYSGSYAEYKSFPEDHVSVIPKTLSFTEAAALSIGLLTSYTFLIEFGQITPGSRVLIHGVSGGTGAIVLQMAKMLGAFVVGTASGDGIELAKSFGADQVIDYKNEDFTKVVDNIDLVIDFVGGQTQADSFKIIKSGGKLLSAFSPPSQELAKKYNVNAEFVIASLSYKNLNFGLKRAEAGIIKPIISRIMQMDDAALAQDFLSIGSVNGKILLEVNS